MTMKDFEEYFIGGDRKKQLNVIRFDFKLSNYLSYLKISLVEDVSHSRGIGFPMSVACHFLVERISLCTGFN